MSRGFVCSHQFFLGFRASLSTLLALVVVGLLYGLVSEAVDADELRLLEELAAGDVHLLLLLGQESDVQGLDVLSHVELLGVGLALAIDGCVEGAQPVDLHLLRVIGEIV